MSARLTPKAFARKLGKSLGFVMALINKGEIVVEDVRAPDAKLPRYEIAETEIARWRASRRVRLGQDKAPRNRHGTGGRMVAEIIR